MVRTSAVVFDWYATLAAPNADDFWTRIPDLVVEGGGVVDQAALREWETDHPVEHVPYSSSESEYRRWQRTRLEQLFEQCAMERAARAYLMAII